MITFPERVKRILVNQKEVELQGVLVAIEQPDTGNWSTMYIETMSADEPEPMAYRIRSGAPIPDVGAKIRGMMAWGDGHYVLEEVAPVKEESSKLLQFPCLQRSQDQGELFATKTIPQTQLSELAQGVA